MKAVRQALETQLAAISAGFATAYENMKFETTVGTPYQAAFIVSAEPDNPEMGNGWMERGYLQVNLFYPLDAGPGSAETRAETIRDAFPRGATFVADGVSVLIERTPEIGPGRADDDWYVKTVKVRYFSQLVRP
ncbi:MAG: hypothetical protein RL268_281 [Pseudomonadota bacterium]|jgi:hypothetical protein